MSVLLSAEKYKQIKKQAQQAYKKLNIENLIAEQKDEVVSNYLKEINLTKPDESEIFYGNCLIPDDKKFYNTYIENGKIVKKSAEAFNVTSKAVFTKVIEIGKYASYLPDLTKKGEEMKEIEIIEEPSMGNVDESAIQVIKTINSLMDTNKIKAKELSELTKCNENLNKEINNLKYLNNEQNERINMLDNQIKQLETNIKDGEEYIKKQDHDIKILLKYKENYEKIVGFLQKNEKNIEN